MPQPLAITAFSILLGLVLTVTWLITSCNAEGALQLISYNESGKYQLHEPALRAIEKLPEPVQVLAAVGNARIGKSTFLNMLQLHWNADHGADSMPFGVDSTSEACTRGLWIYIRRLPKHGSLVFVDVEGANLGNDAVTKQLSALTAVMSSYILLFVSEVVNNAALEFLYHTTKLGAMFPDSDNFPHLGVAIRGALGLSRKFSNRQSEVEHAIRIPTHKDGNDDMRREIARVFSPSQITAFEVQYQDRDQLQNLLELKTGPYYDSVMIIMSELKRTVTSKKTPNGMEMCGGGLVTMIRNLFDTLDNITVLETAFERLEKQMCDEYYLEWILPLQRMTEDIFLSSDQHHLEGYTKLCKIDSYVERVRQEVESKKSGILREREERERRIKAEEEKWKAEEERREAEEARKKEEEERIKQEQLTREANLALWNTEEEKKRIELEAKYERKLADEREKRAFEDKQRLEEMIKKEVEERKWAQQQLAHRGNRGRDCIIL